jgi:hypothetical protein
MYIFDHFPRQLVAWIVVAIVTAPLVAGCEGTPPAEETSGEMQDTNDGVQVIPRENQSRVDVMIDGERFTAYIFDDSLDVLKKPVLYPLTTTGGTSITRGHPIEPRPGERTDHPHHIGHWLNYGDVNGLDFWNNSDAVSEEEAGEMGHIVHRSINNLESGSDRGILEVTTEWRGPDEEVLLEEDTRFVFRQRQNRRIVDRITTLTAVNGRVEMHDNKEGFVAIRVRRELEHQDDGDVMVVGHDGRETEQEVLDPNKITGEYLNADGVTGTAVWGTRSPWIVLNGVVDSNPVAVAILDHPDNVGYPTYWHARGYGLFSANPLGQSVFSEGEEELNYELSDGASTTFHYRLLINAGELTAEQMNRAHEQFINTVE